MAFLDFIAIIGLYNTVEVGYIEGTIPIIKPTGSAIVIVCLCSSAPITPIVCLFFISSYNKHLLRGFYTICHNYTEILFLQLPTLLTL